MERVVVTGCSGSGKTTLAAALAHRLDLPHVELDALHHDEGWAVPSDEEFRARVAAATAGDRWVVDGNYWFKISDIVWPRADTLVFLDLPRWRVMWQVVRRTITRLVTREELWNGNHERWRNLLSREPEKNILLWAWTTHGERPARFEAAVAASGLDDLEVVRCRSRADMAHLLGTV